MSVSGYLHRTVNKVVLQRPWSKSIAAARFICFPGGVEVPSIYRCDATVFEFNVEPCQCKISDIFYRGLRDIITMTLGLNLSPETARMVFLSIL